MRLHPWTEWIENIETREGLARVARRQFLRTTGLLATGALLGVRAVATPACVETEVNGEGPFYKAGAPERAVLVERGMPGTRLTLTGRVTGLDCRQLSGALVDVWQADAAGEYDNAGFTLRGRLYADRSGLYRLETIVPKRYPVGGTQQFRPAHLHFKVSAPGFELLTTQLYFPNDPHNATDSGFRRSLMLDPKNGGDGQLAQFDFVLKPNRRA